MTEDELRQLKAELAKDSPQKTRDKYKKKRPNQKIWPYLLITGSFILGIYLLFIIFDNLIMPSVVEDREKVEVPAVTGIQVEKAQSLLRENHLSNEVSGWYFSQEHESGIVINQYPKNGTEVKVGRIVYITVSRGRDSVQMPYLIGKPVRSAGVLLLRKGLRIGDTIFSYSNEFPRDTIISQSIRPGWFVPVGSEVDVTVSKGPENAVSVPDLTGIELDEAERLLKEKKLETGNIEYIEDGTYLPYVIIRQSPEAGSFVSAGTYINLWVCIEP